MICGLGVKPNCKCNSHDTQFYGNEITFSGELAKPLTSAD